MSKGHRTEALSREQELVGSLLTAHSSLLLGGHQRMCNGMHGQCNPILHPYLAHQLRNVGLHSALLNAKLASDLLIGTTSHEHLQYFLLAIGKSDASGREDAARSRRNPLDEHGKHAPRRPNRYL